MKIFDGILAVIGTLQGLVCLALAFHKHLTGRDGAEFWMLNAILFLWLSQMICRKRGW